MLTYTPFDNPEISKALSDQTRPFQPGGEGTNVGELERVGSIIGGAAIIAAGLSRRSLPGLVLAGLGGLFIFRGVTGWCQMYDSLGVSTAPPQQAGVPSQSGHRVEKTITISRPPEELYRFWRNLENLPEFMENVESVRVVDDRRSHWVVKAPGGQKVEWDAEIVNEHPGEMISWQTLPGADVQSAGTVRFNPAPEGQGTELRVVLEYRPPAGALGAGVARIFGKDPHAQLDHDLARLKELIESHDVSAAARKWS